MKFIIYAILIIFSWKWARYNSREKARLKFREQTGLEPDQDTLRWNQFLQGYSSWQSFTSYLWFVILIIWTIVDAIYDVI